MDMTVGALTSEDLVPDRALVAGDRDDFNLNAIAHRLADLTSVSETPLNIALFGAWGSGKSSTHELLRRALKDKPGNIALVRYDAWKYGGESLKRNFISHAANQLGFRERDSAGEVIKKNRAFHRGLYEKQRRAEVDFRELSLRKLEPVAFFMATFILFIVSFSLVTGMASVLTNEDFLGQIGAALPRFLGPAGVIGGVVAVAKHIIAGATVDVEQSQPAADEEFARVFGELRDRARSEKHHSRLVFFVDELDRCAPDDVVKTLTALRTFLDQEDCVFIVAADREVIEKALAELPQVTPLDIENPYYSSASSFFDKVFHNQVPLPPLRGRRLTRYARDLVSERGGIWAELRAAEPNGRLLDRVIYALIPSHVRSPRRIKVLLNNFATTARIAQSRNVAWLERARELAKLTVLQTEFPLLAADLVHEPKLPTYLLEPPPAPSERLIRLLERHGGVVRTSGDDVESPAALTDVPLASGVNAEDGEEAIKLLAESERRLLRRYLERVQAAGISDPGRDLLYLEAAGAAVGLDDPALGELVENEAAEFPQRVVEALSARSTSDRQAVARVLADMADQEFGDERDNVMTALLDAAHLLGDDVGPVADSILGSVKSYQQEQQLADRFLVSTLALALRTETEGRLVDELFKDPRLFDSAEHAGMVAALLDRVPAPHDDTVRQQVAKHVADPVALRQPLRELPESAAVALIESQEVREAMSAALDEFDGPAAVKFAEDLFAAVIARDAQDKVGPALQRELVGTSKTYPAVRAHADDFIDATDELGRTVVAIIALDWAPASDWSFWSWHLVASAKVGEKVCGWAADAAASIIGKVSAAPDDELASAEEAISRLLPFIERADAAKRASVPTALEEVLNADTWWTSEESVSAQARLHRVGRALLATDSETRQAIEAVLASDVERGLAAKVVVPGYPQRPPSVQLSTLHGLRVLGGELPAAAAARVLATLTTSATGTSAQDTALTRARVGLASAVHAAGAAVDFSAIPTDEILALVAADTDDSRIAIVEWLAIDSPNKQVVEVVRAISGRPARRLVHALRDWAARLDEPGRTEFLKGLLLGASPDPDWVRAVAQHGVDDDALTETLVAGVMQASNADEREEVIDIFVALSPRSHRGQKRVADVIEGLLGSGAKVDFKLALKAVEVLGNQHRSAERLRIAFKSAHEKHGHDIPEKSIASLARAGIKVSQKRSAKSAVRKLLGG